MRIRDILLLLCAVVFIGTAVNAGESSPTGLHYKVKMKSASFGKDAGTREIWLKGDKMRCEIYGGKLRVTVIKNSQGVFLLHPWNKVAGKYTDDSPRGNVRTLLPGPTGSTKAFLSKIKAKKLSGEKVGKQFCEVYSYTEPTTKRHCKLWVDKKTSKPVRLWMQGKHKVMDELTATYVRYDDGTKISDSLFEVPKGYVVRPMPKRELASKQMNSAKPGI